MPNFGADKEALQKVLVNYDTEANKAKEIVGSFKSRKGSAYDNLLIHVLLDACCSFLEKDPVRSNQLCTALEECFVRDKIVSKWIDQSQLNAVRKSASGWFLNYLKNVSKSLPDPLNRNPSVQDLNSFSTKIFPNTYEQNFEEVGVIASGGFGTVCKAVHKIDGNTYAVKKIHYSIDRTEEATKVMNEVLSISTLNHVNIVSYKNCWVQLPNRDDVENESSMSSPNSYASRDFDCSTPCSSVSSRFGRWRHQKKSRRKALSRDAGDTASSDATDLSASSQLTPQWDRNARPVDQWFSTPTITEEQTSQDSSADDFEDVEACLNELEECSSLSFPRDLSCRGRTVSSDSSIVFDYGNEATNFESSVTFCGSSEPPGSEIITKSHSKRENACSPAFRERLKGMLCIQMEYCDWDLNKWLEDRAAGEELPFKKDVKDIFKDIVQGVVHIHSKSIIHRDLKPSNIFYSERDGSMKIGDFGLATLSHTISNQPRAVSFRSHTSNLGTFPYMAPEQKNKTDYDEKVDMYSLGVILIELLVPFKTRSEFHHTLNNIGKGQWPSELTSQWPDFVNLVKNLLQTDPKMRMSAEEILDLPLLQDNAAEVEKRQLLLEIKVLKNALEGKERELEAARREISDLKARIEKLTLQ